MKSSLFQKRVAGRGNEITTITKTTEPLDNTAFGTYNTSTPPTNTMKSVNNLYCLCLVLSMQSFLVASTSIIFEYDLIENTCPPISNQTRCNRMYKPVKCGINSCIYSNMCFAKSASDSFVESTCTSTLASTRACPDVTGEATNKCQGKKNKSLLCGENQCKVGKVCLAKQMGWNRSQCTRENGCRLQRTRKCDNYEGPDAPVICSEETCPYANMCLAKSAGYSESNCKLREID